MNADNRSELHPAQETDTNAPSVTDYLTDHGTLLSSDTICFERLLPGPIERVWAWLTESDKRGLWLASGSMPGQVGAAFDMRFDNTRLTAHPNGVPAQFRKYDRLITTHHKLTRWEPPSVLAMTWGGGDEALSEVTFELEAVGDKVRLVLTHRRLTDVASLLDVSAGWHTHLAVLAEKLAGRTPPEFWALCGIAQAEYAARLDKAD